MVCEGSGRVEDKTRLGPGLCYREFSLHRSGLEVDVPRIGGFRVEVHGGDTKCEQPDLALVPGAGRRL